MYRKNVWRPSRRVSCALDMSLVALCGAHSPLSTSYKSLLFWSLTIVPGVRYVGLLSHGMYGMYSSRTCTVHGTYMKSMTCINLYENHFTTRTPPVNRVVSCIQCVCSVTPGTCSFGKNTNKHQTSVFVAGNNGTTAKWTNGACLGGRIFIAPSCFIWRLPSSLDATLALLVQHVIYIY